MSKQRIAVQLPLGFGSGLPLLLTGSTLTAWLTDAGTSLETIGVFALVSVPYNLKVLWAPLLDRFELPFLGRRRGWIFLAQALLCGAIMVLGAMQPHASLSLAFAAVLVAVLSATQDIVVDAYRTDLLPKDERGKGTATYVMGYRIALLVAGSGALVLADHVSWRATYFIMAGFMVVGMAGTWLGPRAPAIAPPRTITEAVVAPLREFFARPGAAAAIGFVLLYKFGDSLAGHMITPFVLKLGFTKTELGLLQKAMGMAATIAGVGLGGVIADRVGLVKALLWFGILQAAANSGYLMLALFGKSYPVLVAAIAIDNVCNGLGTAALVAYLMALCHHRFSATQYALLTSASSILGRSAGAASGYMIAALGWAGFFALTICVAAPALVLVRRAEVATVKS